MFPLALASAAAMLVVWFPWSSLLHQQGQISTARTEIAAVQRQSASLEAESKSIDTTTAAKQLAREQYQLVSPGQSLIQVLPGDSLGQVSASSADPGRQALVSPFAAPPLTTTHAKTRSAKGFLERLQNTVEFWR